ncbi:MAG TPA: NADH-quinone oxidoreductase subunit NuoG [Acidimicrobiia bacterium]|jgi:NADH-quinone oxidoreductase subunit G|nr:NADH-quinone oxidoreductase subunit NuoG [Acidimicrobiia bacterium]
MTVTQPNPNPTPKTPQPASTDDVTVSIDGREVRAKKGDLLIKVAQDNGVYIPRFCWHERMKPVGMCRMCLVEVEGVRGFPPACTTTVNDGMVCRTQTDPVHKIQDGVLEFLLVNHPLDCPVCDRGGECPLQDQTLSFGPGESRFTEEKRHFEKPIPISDIVMLDRERCIQCARCTRFADEIAGDPLITFVDRGDRTEVLNFPDHPFASYFSGNVVQICPVGALTAKPYRFRARPWDLATVETSCTACAVQCRGALQSSTDRLVRFLGVDSDAVNHGWLCDKGRYGFEYVHDESRVVEPLVREGNGFVEKPWPEALDAAAAILEKTKSLHGAGAIAVLGGAHGSNEDAYVWARLAKGVLGTDHVDAQLGDGLPAEAVLGLPRAEISDLDHAAAIVLIGPDLKDELPVLHLRLRRAAIELKVPVIDLTVVGAPITPTTIALRPAPGEVGVVAERLVAAIGKAGGGGDDAIANAATTLRERAGDVVVVLGRGSVAEQPDATLRAAAALAALPNVKFLSALRRGNVHGALEVGLAPGVLPGRVALDDGRAAFTEAWGGVPDARGLDATGILQAAAAGKIHALVLLGCDPLSDFPDRTLARDALEAVSSIIAVDGFLSDSVKQADVVLPPTMWGEKQGTVTNLEGRVQRLGRKVSPPGSAMDDWRIAGELALRLGSDFDLEQIDEVTEEIARVAPAFAGATAAVLRRARDGVVLPVAEHRDEIVWRGGALTILAEDGSGASWEPIRAGAAGSPDLNDTTAETGTAPEAPEETAAAADTVSAAPAPPRSVVWDRSFGSPDAPGRDAYALRLVTGHTLYEGGRTVVSSPPLAGLVQPRRLRVNASDLTRIGVDDGATVRVTSARGSLDVALHVDASLPAGVARLDFTPGARGAADLIDVSAPVTDVRVETLR